MNASEQQIIEVKGLGEYNERTVKVMYDKTEVVIIWLCGESYTWNTKESLATDIASFEATGKIPDAFYWGMDDRSRRYYSKLEDDNFSATDNPRLTAAIAVPWSDFREALMKAVGVEEKKKRKPATKRK